MISTKTQSEIESLRKGGGRLARILENLREFATVGRPVSEFDKKAAALIRPEDKAAFFQYQPSGAHRPYPAKVCVSVNDAIVHGIPTESEHIIQDGDVVTVDMGLEHDGLITDSAITFVVGTPNQQKTDLVDTACEALTAGINQAQPGNQVGDISAAIQEAIGGGYAIFRQLVGHGVGYSVHEEPTIPNFGESGTGATLPVGAVLAIEPMIGLGSARISQDGDGYTYRTADGSLSAHFEHTVAVTEDGPEVLTSN